MASLQDFFAGMPLYDNPLQGLVDAIEKLTDQTARIIWVRNPSGEGSTRKDTRDGDNVITVAVFKGLDNLEITSNTEDANREVAFPYDFSRPPVVIGQPQATKPVMMSISNVTEKGFTASFRSVGALDGRFNVTGVHYIAVGVKNTSG